MLRLAPQASIPLFEMEESSEGWGTLEHHKRRTTWSFLQLIDIQGIRVCIKAELRPVPFCALSLSLWAKSPVWNHRVSRLSSVVTPPPRLIWLLSLKSTSMIHGTQLVHSIGEDVFGDSKTERHPAITVKSWRGTLLALPKHNKIKKSVIHGIKLFELFLFQRFTK